MKDYSFVDVQSCNMCGASLNDARVLGTRLSTSQGYKPRTKKGIAITVCRCGGCGLIFAAPMPMPRSLDDHYGIPPETYWKDHYFKPAPDYFGTQIDAAKALLGPREHLTALDIGAGVGKAMRAMRNAGFDVWGIEPSLTFHNKAIELGGLPAERLQCASVENATFAPRFFDFITFGAVLEHLYDPSASIAKALTWLKDDGIIHIEVPSSNYLMSKILNFYFRAVGTNYVTNISPMHSPYHLYEFTPTSFEVNGARIGYTVARHHIEVASIRHVPSMVKPLMRYVMDRQGSGMQLVVYLRAKSGTCSLEAV
ncbi:class I SAM-dependent methyltransferase [Rhodomicrobium vannielii ATCC 17100]|uniref:class I SAM-dependent methyltransferase n=1 Tax=Rhodomicrobium vannielii TaxID=1069 RepID=UPI00191B8B83|nr:class I SAM-dependent methyltransferase [Rhodomicrobium vannielii]MBJ7533223.1 class I SAM-dependent methyltransferase [Rhodomicrobium vannielii ATCC 17100]